METDTLANLVVLTMPEGLAWVVIVYFGAKLAIDGMSLWNGWRTLQHEIRMESVRAKAYAEYLRSED